MSRLADYGNLTSAPVVVVAGCLGERGILGPPSEEIRLPDAVYSPRGIGTLNRLIAALSLPTTNAARSEAVKITAVGYVSHPIPSLSLSNPCGSGAKTVKLRYGMSTQFRFGGGGEMQTVG
jgi:hypothetical protein